ncbi:hypothetical protein BDW69DRAFT_17688 [Aspergillus filifer]
MGPDSLSTSLSSSLLPSAIAILLSSLFLPEYFLFSSSRRVKDLLLNPDLYLPLLILIPFFLRCMYPDSGNSLAGQVALLYSSYPSAVAETGCTIPCFLSDLLLYFYFFSSLC